MQVKVTSIEKKNAFSDLIQSFMKTQMLPSLQAIHLFRELSDEGDRYPLISYSATAKNIKSVSKYWNHPPLGTGGQMEKMQSKCRTVANSKRIISYSCNR